MGRGLREVFLALVPGPRGFECYVAGRWFKSCNTRNLSFTRLGTMWSRDRPGALLWCFMVPCSAPLPETNLWKYGRAVEWWEKTPSLFSSPHLGKHRVLLLCSRNRRSGPTYLCRWKSPGFQVKRKVRSRGEGMAASWKPVLHHFSKLSGGRKFSEFSITRNKCLRHCKPCVTAHYIDISLADN